MEQQPSPIPFEIFHGDGRRSAGVSTAIPAAPPWRRFGSDGDKHRGATFLARDAVRNIVNAALHLRRPILITGDPGTGKSSVAYAVADELGLGPVLKWPINSRSTLKEGLYQYDAIGRLQDAQQQHLQATAGGPAPAAPGHAASVGDYITLGALGTAMACSARGRPRVLLIDEIDKSDIDLPNDLLHIFEDGYFEIPELLRLPPDRRSSTDVFLQREIDGKRRLTIRDARVSCEDFPFVVMTSNGERELPPAFHRRCLRLDLHLPPDEPSEASSELHRFLDQVVRSHLSAHREELQNVDDLINDFRRLRHEEGRTLAVDQLLQAVFLVRKGVDIPDTELDRLKAILLKDLRG